MAQGLDGSILVVDDDNKDDDDAYHAFASTTFVF